MTNLEMKVLIIGAGAVGTTLGYLLTKDGGQSNNVTYLVREHRLGFFHKSTINLFCYDNKEVVSFIDFSLVTNKQFEEDEQVRAKLKDVEVVIVTLHSDSLDTTDGRHVIKLVATHLSPTCMFLCVSPGFKVKQSVFIEQGISNERLSFAYPLFICHEVPMRWQPQDYRFSAINGATYAFHYMTTRFFPLIVSKNPNKVLSKLYKGNGKVMAVGTELLEATIALFIIMNLVSSLQGYPEKLDKTDPKFQVGVAAFRQISRIHGNVGTVMRTFIGKAAFKLFDSWNKKMTKPLSIEFFKYHQGNKIMGQNIFMLNKYIQSGKEQNKDVDELSQFLTYFQPKLDNRKTYLKLGQSVRNLDV